MKKYRIGYFLHIFFLKSWFLILNTISADIFYTINWELTNSATFCTTPKVQLAFREKIAKKVYGVWLQISLPLPGDAPTATDFLLLWEEASKIFIGNNFSTVFREKKMQKRAILQLLMRYARCLSAFWQFKYMFLTILYRSFNYWKKKKESVDTQVWNDIDAQLYCEMFIEEITFLLK